MKIVRSQKITRAGVSHNEDNKKRVLLNKGAIS
ncbi:MAG: hypothetical protein ACI9AV_001056 [Sediminicola sp.]|jgi:hypothetical protein